MPDIDCDFSVEGREKVIRYVSEKYGADRVAQIITFTTMASKAAIRDVGRVLEVPLRDTDRLAKLVPVWQGRSKTLEDTIKVESEFREAYESSVVTKRMVVVARTLEGVSSYVSMTVAGLDIAPALLRPGPMQDIPAYISRKHGREPITYPHEWLQPILESTYGVFTYQEQVMEAARVLAGFKLSEADILRSAMGKKDRVKMAKQREKFVQGAVNKGIADASAEQLFDRIAAFASYGFNKSHSAAYAGISYQTAYLKANYPPEYMTALLVHMEGNAERVATAIVDCRLRGIDVLAPDINASRADFSMTAGPSPSPPRGEGQGEGHGEGRGSIQFGLAAIKNVGRHAVESIVALGEADGTFKSLEELCERASAIQDVNRRVLEALVQSGACDTLGERARLIAALDHAVSRAERARRDRESGQTSLLDMVGSPEVAADDFGLTIDVAPMAGEEKLRLEKELLGLYLSDHPLRRITAELARLSDTQAVEVTSALQDTEVRVAGLVREVRRVVTRKGPIKAHPAPAGPARAGGVGLLPPGVSQTPLLF